MTSIKSVCVYCGSSNKVDDIYKDLATQTGKNIAEAGQTVVYGGGRVGMMGLCADAALAAGGEVIGIIPEHIQVKEVEHTGLTQLHVVDSMHTRKMMMAEKSDAFVILPGGVGTLDETFEIFSWRQLGLHNKPIIIVNIEGYWDHMIAQIDHIINKQFAPEDDRKYLCVINNLNELQECLARQPEPTRNIEDKWM